MENKNDTDVQATPVAPETAAEIPVTPVPPISPSEPEASAKPQAATPPDASASAVEPPPANTQKALINPNDMGFLNDVSIALTIEIGRTQIKIRDLLNLTKDSIIDLNKGSSEPVDIYANGKMISRGHIITANGKYCVRLTSIAQPLTDKTE